MIYKGKRSRSKGWIILAAILVVLSGATAVFYYGILGGELPGKSTEVAAPAKAQSEKKSEMTASETKKQDKPQQQEETAPAEQQTTGDTPAKTEEKPAVQAEPLLTDQTVLTAAVPGGSITGIKAVGVVNGEGVSFRGSADTSGELLDSLPAGTVVSVTGAEGQWYKVSYGEQSGYIHAAYLEPHTRYEFRGTGLVLADSLNVRTDPRPSSRMLYQLENHAHVTVIGFDNGWFAVSTDWGDGYVSGDYLALGTSAQTDKAVTPDGQTTTAASDVGAAIAAKAKELLGSAYSYGGSGPDSFDCSGFTMYVCGLFNITLPHGATSQYSYGTAVAQADLQPGDLVFFSYGSDAIGHVGIYIGDRSFVHASTYDVGVIISSLDGGSYPSRYVGARRMTVS